MLVTFQQREGMMRFFACFLKAHFTKGELAAMVSNQVTLVDILHNGYFDSASRGEGQKISLSLMSFYPMDDKNDLLVMFARDFGRLITPRYELGTPGRDNFLENTEDLASKLGSLVTNAAKTLGLVDTGRMMYTSSGELTAQVADSDLEVVNPQFDFSDPETAVRKLQLITPEGRPSWNSW